MSTYDIQEENTFDTSFAFGEDALAGLNDAQTEAVTATEGYIRVIAGAGSGKTRALTHRFAYLVTELGILPGNILCVTFTNKSANEMRQRIHRLTGDNDTGYINTFHGFCVSILQEDSHAVSYPKSFIVLDNSDIDQMLKLIYEERGLTLRNMTFGAARDMIEIRKTLENPDYYKDLITMSLETIHEKYMEAKEPRDIIFYGYLYQEKKCFALDYNDLILFSLYIFEENEQIRLKWQSRLEYIMIDEFQDIDPLQYRLMEVLCAYHHNLFVVGDPDQTIYTWRGADVKYLLDFDKKFPNVRTIMMMDNYRSTPQILAAVNSLIDKNTVRMKKQLIPMLPDGEDVVCHFAPTAEKEARWIADRILELQQSGTPAKDITVLYRAHYVTRNLETVFQKAEIPYQIYSGVQFYDRMEIKDTLSYLRMIVYRDDLSFRRICNVPKRNLGERRMAFLEEYAAANGCTLYEALTKALDNGNELFRGTGAGTFVSMIERLAAGCAGRSVTEVLNEVLERSGYEKMLRTEGSQERLDNLAELKQSIFEYEISCGEEASLEDYLRHAALFTNRDVAEAQDRIKMMTVHTAKGLEFPYVFLCGMNEGIFPSRKINTFAAMEEERRLAYVAMTRAEKKLFITEGSGRNFDGSMRYPSRFILDIDPGLISFTEKPADDLVRNTMAYVKFENGFFKDNAAPALKEGTRIRHKVFGDGTILFVDREKNSYQIQFDSAATPRVISARVNLTVID